METAQQTEKLRFYCDDDGGGGGGDDDDDDDDASYDLTVENDVRAIDLCELLKAKRRAFGVDWSIVETWPELGIGRYYSREGSFALSMPKQLCRTDSRNDTRLNRCRARAGGPRGRSGGAQGEQGVHLEPRAKVRLSPGLPQVRVLSRNGGECRKSILKLAVSRADQRQRHDSESQSKDDALWLGFARARVSSLA